MHDSTTVSFISKVTNFCLPILISVLAPSREIMLLLLIVVMIDTLLGIIKAIKLKIFSSVRLRSAMLKVFIYLSIIVLGAIFDKVNPLGLPISLAQIFASLFVIQEIISSIETIEALGIKVPFSYILSKFKLAIPEKIGDKLFNGSFSQDINTECRILLGKEKSEIFCHWLAIVQQLVRESKKYIVPKPSELLRPYNLRIKSHMQKHYDIDPKYVEYLLGLTTKKFPASRDDIYMLANKAMEYDNDNNASDN